MSKDATPLHDHKPKYGIIPIPFPHGDGWEVTIGNMPSTMPDGRIVNSPIISWKASDEKMKAYAIELRAWGKSMLEAQLASSKNSITPSDSL
jgi:hypothetical protein